MNGAIISGAGHTASLRPNQVGIKENSSYSAQCRRQEDFAVADLNRSVRFYQEVMGLQVIKPERADQSVQLRDEAGSRLRLVPGQRRACCETQLAVDEVDACYRRVSAAGATINRYLHFDPQAGWQFVVEDPDGHRVSVHERSITEDIRV